MEQEQYTQEIEQDVENGGADTESVPDSVDTDGGYETLDAEEFIVNTPDGRELVLKPDDIVDLTQKVGQYEQRIRQLEQLEQYAPLLNYITNDELVNRVILYRLQGNSPANIVKYLYEYFDENGMFDSQKSETQATEPKQELDSLKQELHSLREYMTVQQVVQQNAAQLMKTAEQLGVEVDEGQDYTQVLAEISQDLYGDRTYIVRVPLNQRQARVVIQELKERLASSKPGGAPGVRARAAQRVNGEKPRQFPAGVKTGGGGSDEKVQGTWNPAKARDAYLKLLGG